MLSSRQPDNDPPRQYPKPTAPLPEFARDGAQSRERATNPAPKTTDSRSDTSRAPITPSANAQTRGNAKSKRLTDLVLDSIRDQMQSAKLSHPPAQASRLCYVKRIVDHRGGVRFYYVRGSKPHVRLDAPEGTPAFLEAYEAARSAKAARWRAAQRSSKSRRSMAELVKLYQRSDDYARLAPQTQRVYDRVLRRLLAEGIADSYAAEVSRKRIQQLVSRRADAPAAAADLLKKLRILFRCAIAHGWRADDPTRGVAVDRSGQSAGRPAT